MRSRDRAPIAVAENIEKIIRVEDEARQVVLAVRPSQTRSAASSARSLLLWRNFWPLPVGHCQCRKGTADPSIRSVSLSAAVLGDVFAHGFRADKTEPGERHCRSPRSSRFAGQPADRAAGDPVYSDARSAQQPFRLRSASGSCRSRT